MIVAGNVRPPRTGDVFVLPESEYRYGAGPLIARVKQVRELVEYHDEPWWLVSAEAANGTPENHGAWHERDLYIRESTFSRTRRVPRP